MLNGRALVAQCCSSRAQWPATEYGIGVSSLVCFLEIPCIWRHVFIPFNMLQVPSTVFEHGQTTTGYLSWRLASKHIRDRERLPLGSKITLKGDWIMIVCIRTPCCLGSSYTKEFKSFLKLKCQGLTNYVLIWQLPDLQATLFIDSRCCSTLADRLSAGSIRVY